MMKADCLSDLPAFKGSLFARRLHVATDTYVCIYIYVYVYGPYDG